MQVRKQLVLAVVAMAITGQPSRGAVAANHPNRAVSRSRPALRFEPNRGQADPRVSFIAHANAYAVLLTTTEAIATFGGAGAVRLRLEGSAGRAVGQGEQPLPCRTSYFVGNDPMRWRTGLSTFARVRYSGVYPGVDIVYYGGDRDGLEYDFVIAPGGDPNAIRLRFEGASSAYVGDDGDVVVPTATGELRQRRPTVYQTVEGERRPVSGAFVRRSDGTFGFRLGEYDRSFAITIDPLLSYGTYVGGSGDDTPQAMAIDAYGAIYLAGLTQSTDFPSAVPLAGAPVGGVDAFVVKLAPAGDAIEYAAYIGGSGTDFARGIAVTGDGRVVVAGPTNSPDFPTRNAVQPAFAGASDEFVLEIGPTGTTIEFSTYLGGSANDVAAAVRVDAAGNIYVAGTSLSSDYPAAHAFQSASGGRSDGTLVKLRPDGQVAFATYLGGTGDEQINALAVGADESVYVAMSTTSQDLETSGAIASPYAGGPYDGYVAKIAPSGSSLVYATYLGGSGDDEITSVAIDALGNLYALERTNSTDFPTRGPFQTAFAGGALDGTITKIDPNGASIVYSSYFGGSGTDYLGALQIDALGAALVTGFTTSADFPTVNQIAGARGGGDRDLVAARVSPRGDRLEYSTYIGGGAAETSNTCVLDPAGNLYIGAATASPNFPTLMPFQASPHGGPGDAALVKVADRYSLTWSPPATADGSPGGLRATLVESGDAHPFTVPSPSPGSPGADLVGYRVYRSPSQGVRPVEQNLFAEVPRDRTTIDGGAPGGSAYVVTAVYADGTEGPPSGEISAGAGTGASLAKVSVKVGKIVGKGAGFTTEVQVFVDGIPFASPATVKQGKKVIQRGELVTGETLEHYLSAHKGRVMVAFRNSDGGVSASRFGR